MAHLTNFSFEFLYEIFIEDASLRLLNHGAKKSKMTKNSNQGGPALSIWKVFCQHQTRQNCFAMDPSVYLPSSMSSCWGLHIITAETAAPDPEKLTAVTEWPVPRSVKQVQQFLGFTNFSRWFIQGNSSMSRPLEPLTAKYTKFIWVVDHQQAFEKLRTALLEAPVLGLADMTKSFCVVSDASDQAIGAVLLQADEGGGG